MARTPLSTPERLKRIAVTVWLTPTLMLFPLWLGPLMEPAMIPEALARAWHLYLLFLGLPFAAAMLLWWIARRMEAKARLPRP